MSGNTLGEIFRITTFGESHGPALGVVIDGCPAGLELSEADIQPALDRRRPGQSSVTTPRQEADQVEILSGLFEGKTTGTPLALIIRNQQMRSKDYSAIKDLYRPGHADAPWEARFGHRDYRGGGRSSGRETAARVAAGAVAQKLLAQGGITITAWTQRAAGISCQTFQADQIEKNPLRAPDPQAAAAMQKVIEERAAQGDSSGGIIACSVEGLPAGWGNPVFDKADALLARAMLSLGAVKAFEIGEGFAAADLTGSQMNDQRTAESGYLSNHSGGTLGGITSGQPLRFRIAVKPTPSITLPQQTLDRRGRDQSIATHGRHDPCICPRLVPVVEAMTALVLADLSLTSPA